MKTYDKKPLGFISFSCGLQKRFADRRWLERLITALIPLERHGQLTLWIDTDIEHGDEWYGQIREVMERARVALILVSPDYLASDFCMREEFPYLVERAEAGGLILLPILLRPCNWTKERWLDQHQMKPAGGRALSTFPIPKQDQILAEIVAALDARLDNLKARKPVATSWPLDRCDITRLPASGKELFGRKEELAWLDACWRTPTTNVVSLIAWGGVGKSALVNRWLEGMAKKDWDGAERVFGWYFYSQGSHENSAASADLFIDTALRWFRDRDPAAGSPWDKGERLADLIKKQRTLLVLDGLEPLQWASGDTGRIKDPALATLVESLAAGHPGLVLITSRMHVTGLEDFDKAAVPERDLRRLTKEDGRAVLRVRGARGWDRELEAMSEAFGNHAFAVSLLASWLRTLDPPHLPKVEAIPDLPEVQQDERPAHRVIAAFAERFGEGPERQVLRILGLFDRPASKGELDALRVAQPIPALTDKLTNDKNDKVWVDAYDALERLGLIDKRQSDGLVIIDAHSVIRRYFYLELKELFPTSYCNAHDFICKHLVGSRKTDRPDKIDDFDQFYLAAAHACSAGRYDYALHGTLMGFVWQGGEWHSVDKKGLVSADLSALSNFFLDGEMEKVVPDLSIRDAALVQCEAGYRFRNIGKLEMAAELLRSGIEKYVIAGDHKAGAIEIGLHAEIICELGRLSEALERSGEAIKYADRETNNDVRQRLFQRVTRASILHQMGRYDDANAEFLDAERIVQDISRGVTAEKSGRGYRYCDFLIDRGQYDEASTRPREALNIARKRGRLVLQLRFWRISDSLRRVSGGGWSGCSGMVRGVAGLGE